MNRIPERILDAIEHILPKKKSKVGRPETPPRKAFAGMWYVDKTGCQWSMLPSEFGKPSTVHGKFMKWCRSGIFDKIMKMARKLYMKKNQKNNWLAVDTSSRKAPFANFSGKNPTDRGKRGIKYAVLVDRKGLPINVDVGAANTHDSKFLPSLLNQLKTQKKLTIIAADSAFDAKKLYQECKQKNLALIASPNQRRKKDVHKFNIPNRWVVEQSFGILSWYRGLKICWSKTLEASLAFLQLACSIRLLSKC